MKAAFFRNMVLVLVLTLGMIGISAAQMHLYRFRVHKLHNITSDLVETIWLKGLQNRTKKDVQDIFDQIGLFMGDEKLKRGKRLKILKNAVSKEFLQDREIMEYLLEKALLPIRE